MGQVTTFLAQKDIIMRLREELALRRMSRASLADQARISLSSLEKSLAGQRPFTDRTLVRLEKALGLSFRTESAKGATVAPEHLGSYARAAVTSLEGTYLTVRPSSSEAGALYAYEIEIEWDLLAGHLVFAEKGRTDKDYSQAGHVSFPHQSGHVYLVTNKHGQHRMALLSRQSINGELKGLLLTLQVGQGSQLQPAAMPIVLIPRGQFTAELKMGTIKSGHPLHDDLSARLARTLDEGFALMLPRGGGSGP
jgi:transcriptional regulator with XRE-family HTH domain